MCWGDGEDIADRHTTSRGGRVPLQSDNGRTGLVLNEGYTLGLSGRVGTTESYTNISTGLYEV